ncbi:MAG: LysE family translocator [Beijerinckiaceae bacterium]
MNLETWLAFALASAIVIVTPGPTVTLAVSYALGQGWRAVAPVAVGTILGDATAVTLSLIGVGALLLASPGLFTGLQWVGAAYLVWLGWRMMRASGAAAAAELSERPDRARMLLHAWFVTALNPKSITFFVAFLPQFMSAAAPLWRQAAILGATFVAIAALNILCWTYLAARTRAFAASERTLVWFNRAGGLTLIGAGAWVGLKSLMRS